jgi:hypothetical protein
LFSFILEFNGIKIIKSLNTEGVINKKTGEYNCWFGIPPCDLTLVDFSFSGWEKGLGFYEF